VYTPRVVQRPATLDWRTSRSQSWDDPMADPRKIPPGDKRGHNGTTAARDQAPERASFAAILGTVHITPGQRQSKVVPA
ncbi:MAG: hypothetical protein M3443_18805, partial [Actinomycetota bacterium]|nr:hypothetical protein [Actinomycetota bacterium]